MLRGKGKLFFYKELKNYVILTLATVILVSGIYVFKFPNHFSFGGVTGIAIILAGISTYLLHLIFQFFLI